MVSQSVIFFINDIKYTELDIIKYVMFDKNLWFQYNIYIFFLLIQFDFTESKKKMGMKELKKFTAL